jgi:ferritin-like metal-binding protein YciE
MSEKTLNDLFLTTLKDVYYAEKAILRALPKLAKAAESEDLKEAFLTHRNETAGANGLLAALPSMLGGDLSTCTPARGQTSRTRGDQTQLLEVVKSI